MRHFVFFLLIVLTLTLAACGGDSHEHSYVTDWSRDAVSHWHAAACEHSDEVADKAAHSLVTTVTREETCTEDGEQTVTCSVCGYTSTETIPASHALESVEAKAPTCAEAGWDAYEKCTRCDYTTYAEKTAEHTFEKGICTGCQIDYDTSWYDPEATTLYIDSVEDFIGLRRLVNGGVDTFNNKWIYLMNDLSFEGRSLLPIGTSSEGRHFRGWFDGCGHVISNFVIGGDELKPYRYEAVGLFGYLGDYGKVMRLGISDFTVNVTDPETKYVGGMVGLLGTGNVARCYAVNGSVKGTSQANVGGLVGVAMGGKVSHSYTTVTVEGKQVGGIAGGLGKSVTRKQGTVEECFSIGDLTGYSYVNPIVSNDNSEYVIGCYYFEDQKYPQRQVNTSARAKSATMEQLCSEDFIFETLGWSKNNSWVIHENALPTLVQGIEEKK